MGKKKEAKKAKKKELKKAKKFIKKIFKKTDSAMPIDGVVISIKSVKDVIHKEAPKSGKSYESTVSLESMNNIPDTIIKSDQEDSPNGGSGS